MIRTAVLGSILGAAGLLALGVSSVHAQKTSIGTAFAVNADGDLLTNEHVITGCATVTVQQGATRVVGRIMASDKTDDLAIIHLNEKTPMFASLRKTPALRAGEQAITYGFPLAGALSTEGNLTIGYVSALKGLRNNPNYIQITTPVQVGNSGGPLLDSAANVIGVVAAKLNAVMVLRQTGDVPQNVNFAVELETAKRFLAKNRVMTTEAATAQELRPADIGDKAKLFTYQVECATGTLARATREDEPGRPVRPEERARLDERTLPGERTPSGTQRAVLYEEEPTGRDGRRYSGSVVWRTDRGRTGADADFAVRAEIEIPQRGMTAELAVRRNTDRSVPASHTIEVRFKAARDTANEISNVRGILMKDAERGRSTALAGITVKVRSGVFLIGLSTAETDLQRNVRLMREAAWLDIALVYDNGRRAILAIEKGAAGDRSFADALARWGNAYVTQDRPQVPGDRERDRLIEQTPSTPTYRRGPGGGGPQR